jgi:hypothetical protein
MGIAGRLDLAFMAMVLFSFFDIMAFFVKEGKWARHRPFFPSYSLMDIDALTLTMLA